MKVLIDGIEYFPKSKLKPSNETLGQFLKKLRKEFHFSLDAVAERSGSSKSYIWEVEHDRVEPSLSKARKFCDLYGISLDSLPRE